MPMQPILLGGLFIGVLSALPVVNLANCCCIWVIGGGMLAAYLDQQPGPPRGLGRGALDGFLAGIAGAFVFLVVSSVISALVAPLQQRMLEELLNGNYDVPPEARAWLEMVRDREQGFVAGVVGFMFQLFAGMIFGTLGGLLGALFFWRDNVPRARGAPQPPPPLPPN
jgi:hypothetical protein